jgi:hypothetical protein
MYYIDLGGDHSLLPIQIKGTPSSAYILTPASCPVNIGLSLMRISRLTNMHIFLNPHLKLYFGHVDLKAKLKKILNGDYFNTRISVISCLEIIPI